MEAHYNDRDSSWWVPFFLELQCTLILLLTVQSTMSLRMAGRTLEKFLYTSTRHPSLGRGNSVKKHTAHVNRQCMCYSAYRYTWGQKG